MQVPVNTSEEYRDEAWDRAVAARLSKLRTMPIDTSRVERALRAQIGVAEHASDRKRIHIWRLGPFRTLAASVALIGAVVTVLMLSTSSGPALASPAQMASMHEELVSGQMLAVRVDSIEAANKVLSDEWPQSPGLPGVPKDHVMACCMKSFNGKKLACVLIKSDGVPVSLMVAHSADLRVPGSPLHERDGVRYHVQSSGKLQMVMTDRQGRLVCLIAELPAERLMDIAKGLSF
jgi:hypothetical protein